MHLKVFVKLNKTLKTVRLGKKTQKTQKNPKKNQKPKKPTGLVFFKKTRVFFQPCTGIMYGSWYDIQCTLYSIRCWGDGPDKKPRKNQGQDDRVQANISHKNDPSPPPPPRLSAGIGISKWVKILAKTCLARTDPDWMDGLWWIGICIWILRGGGPASNSGAISCTYIPGAGLYTIKNSRKYLRIFARKKRRRKMSLYVVSEKMCTYM
jgi:hypothetical protein